MPSQKNPPTEYGELNEATQFMEQENLDSTYAVQNTQLVSGNEESKTCLYVDKARQLMEEIMIISQTDTCDHENETLARLQICNLMENHFKTLSKVVGNLCIECAVTAEAVKKEMQRFEEMHQEDEEQKSTGE